MKKFFIKILILTIFFTGALASFGVVEALSADEAARRDLEAKSLTLEELQDTIPNVPEGEKPPARTILKGKGDDKNERECLEVTLFVNWTINEDVCAAKVSQLVMTVSATGLWISGIIFDEAIEKSFKQINTFSSGSGGGGFTKAWEVSRDMANMFFIFVLLAIAIATILRYEDYGAKRLLAKLIIIALLVNFSLVITKVVIDSSNVIASSLYERIITNEKGAKEEISGKFMRSLGLGSIYQNKGITKTTSLDGNVTGKDISVIPKDGSTAWVNILMIGVFGSILMLVTAFVFLAGAILFVIRTVVLVFLMILSPLAFVAMIWPGTAGLAQKWWKTLFDQAFFAPIYLFLIFAVLRIITSENKVNDIGETKNFATAIIGSESDVTGTIFTFFILIAMMIAALVIAKSMSGTAGAAALRLGKSAGKRAGGYARSGLSRGASRLGRETLGRAGGVIAGSEWAKNLASSKNPALRVTGAGILKSSNYAAGLGKKGGYKGLQARREKSEIEYGELLGEGAGGEERLESHIERLQGRRDSIIPERVKRPVAQATGVGSSSFSAAEKLQKGVTKEASKNKKEKVLVNLISEKKTLGSSKESDSKLLNDLRDKRSRTEHAGELANIGDSIKEIQKRDKRRLDIENEISKKEDELNLVEAIDGLKSDIEKQGKKSDDKGGGKGSDDKKA